jgi:uncharacterized protein YdiU (UPF0061 family)
MVEFMNRAQPALNMNDVNALTWYRFNTTPEAMFWLMQVIRVAISL